MSYRTKPDSERGAHGAWLRRERLARKWRAKDVVQALAAYDIDVTESWIRGIEAGPRPPGADVQSALESIFGNQPDGVEPPPDMYATLVAIETRLADIEARLDELRAKRAGEAELLDIVRAEREALRQARSSAKASSTEPKKRR